MHNSDFYHNRSLFRLRRRTNLSTERRCWYIHYNVLSWFLFQIPYCLAFQRLRFPFLALLQQHQPYIFCHICPIISTAFYPSKDNARLLSVNSHRPIVPFRAPLHWDRSYPPPIRRWSPCRRRDEEKLRDMLRRVMLDAHALEDRLDPPCRNSLYVHLRGGKGDRPLAPWTPKHWEEPR